MRWLFLVLIMVCVLLYPVQQCDTCASQCGQLCNTGCDDPTNNPDACNYLKQICGNQTMYNLSPPLQTGDYKKMCFGFNTTQSNINMQMCIEGSGCQSGNVLWLQWSLYDIGGNLVANNYYPNMSYSPVSPGADYCLCYEWQAGCTQNKVRPFVYSHCLLSILEYSFEVLLISTTRVKIDLYATPPGNNFIVERKRNLEPFEPLRGVLSPDTHITMSDTVSRGNYYYRLSHEAQEGIWKELVTRAVNVYHDYAISITGNTIQIHSNTVMQYELFNIIGGLIDRGSISTGVITTPSGGVSVLKIHGDTYLIPAP